jgi:hypothetical protein
MNKKFNELSPRCVVVCYVVKGVAWRDKITARDISDAIINNTLLCYQPAE